MATGSVSGSLECCCTQEGSCLLLYDQVRFEPGWSDLTIRVHEHEYYSGRVDEHNVREMCMTRIERDQFMKISPTLFVDSLPPRSPTWDVTLTNNPTSRACSSLVKDEEEE